MLIIKYINKAKFFQGFLYMLQPDCRKNNATPRERFSLASNFRLHKIRKPFGILIQ